MMSYAVIVIAITAAGYWTLLRSPGPRRERFTRRSTDASSIAARLELMSPRSVLGVVAWAALFKTAVDLILRDRVKSKKSTH